MSAAKHVDATPTATTAAATSSLNASDVSRRARRESGGGAGGTGGGEEQCIALVDYDALQPDEISFRRGDIIHVTMKGASSGFWGGYVAVPARSFASASASASAPPPPLPPHKTGLFPNCFVTSNMRAGSSQANSFRNKALCLYNYTPDPPPPAAATAAAATAGVSKGASDGGGVPTWVEMPLRRGDLVTVIQPSFAPGWWLGVNEDDDAEQEEQEEEGEGGSDTDELREGTGDDRLLDSESQRFAKTAVNSAEASKSSERRRSDAHAQRTDPPSLTLREREDSRGSTATTTAAAVHRVRLFPINYVTCDIVRAVFGFRARQPHEMSMAAGDVVRVHRRWNDGWWEGSLLRGPNAGAQGIFPSNYTVPNIPTTQPRFFCNRCKTVYEDDLISQTYGNNNNNSRETPPQPNYSYSSAAQHSEDGARPATAAAAVGRDPNADGLRRDCRRCAATQETLQDMVRALDEHYDRWQRRGQGGDDGRDKSGERLDLFRYVPPERDPGLTGGRPAATSALTAAATVDSVDMRPDYCNSRRLRASAFPSSTV